VPLARHAAVAAAELASCTPASAEPVAVSSADVDVERSAATVPALHHASS